MNRGERAGSLEWNATAWQGMGGASIGSLLDYLHKENQKLVDQWSGVDPSK